MNPSLLLIPDRYKAAKLYSQIPDSGAGDLTFARNSNATRVNSAGLIEKVRTNLILQSEAFNTTWNVVSMSVTPNTTANPLNAALTADTITLSAGTIQKYIEQGIVLSGNFTASVYLKAGTHQFVQFLLGTDPAPFANFDLVNGTASATSSTASIVAVGNGWYRCSMSFTSVIGTNVIMLGIDSLGATRFLPTASTGTFIAFGAQLEAGDIATDYIPTTTAAVSVGITADIPRLDYTGGGCPSLLLEPQRTNLVTFSEQFDNAAWLKRANIGITANAIVSPDGTTNADKMAVTNASVVDYGCFQIVASGLNTYSVFAKKAELDYLFIGFNNDLASEGVFFNLNTGAISSNPSSYSATITDYGNGWYRCSVYFATNVSYFFISPSVNGTSFNFSGQSGNGIYIYGAQAEVGSYVSSYIPTLGASVTRVSDAASKTGISSLIGQTEGVAFIDFVWNGLTGVGGFPRIIELATDSSNYIQLYSIAGTTSWGWDIVNGGVVQFTGGSTMALGRNKIAIGYKLNDMVIYKNGTLVASDATCTVPATSALGVTGLFNGAGGAQLAASVNQTLLFTTRLSNAELQSLTAL